MSTKRNLCAISDVLPHVSNKRLKSHDFIDPSVILEGLKRAEMTSDQAVVWVREMREAALGTKPTAEPNKQKIIQSATLDMTDIRNLLNVQHDNESADSMWVLPLVEEPPRMGTTWVETVIKELKGDSHWGVDTSETLTRTIVLLLLVDRKQLLSKAGPLDVFRMVHEYPITTQTVEKYTIINGRCDFVLGYGGHAGKNDISFGLVAIEIKKRYGLGTTVSAQLVAYLVGLQQRCRSTGGNIKFVYGIATDGVNYIFHRLDEDLNLQCVTVIAAQKSLIHHYIDSILESTMHSSRSEGEVDNHIEKTLWKHPIPITKAIVDPEDFGYVLVADENGEPCLKLAEEINNDEDQDKDEGEEGCYRG